MQNAAVGPNNEQAPVYGPQNITRYERVTRSVTSTISNIVHFVTQFFNRQSTPPAQSFPAEEEIPTVELARHLEGTVIDAEVQQPAPVGLRIHAATQEQLDGRILDLLALLANNPGNEVQGNMVLESIRRLNPLAQVQIASRRHAARNQIR